MKVKCRSCGMEEDEYWMVRLSTGVNVEWLCGKCYKAAQAEAAKAQNKRFKAIKSKPGNR